MATITNILNAIRRFGTRTQKSALRRQDDQLRGQKVLDRRLETHRGADGAVEVFVATVAPMPESIVALSDNQSTGIAEDASDCERFVERFVRCERRSVTIADLDSAFELWMRSEDKRGYSRDDVVRLTGAALGELCIRSFGMRWIQLTDSEGTVVALQGREMDFRAFPFHSVSKRIDDGEYGFFRAVFIGIEAASKSAWQPTEGA